MTDDSRNHDVTWHSEYQVAMHRCSIGLGIVFGLHVGWLIFGSALLKAGFQVPSGFWVLSVLPLGYALLGLQRLFRYSMYLAEENQSVLTRCFWCNYDLSQVNPLTANKCIVRCPECGGTNWCGPVPHQLLPNESAATKAHLAKLILWQRGLLRAGKTFFGKRTIYSIATLFGLGMGSVLFFSALNRFFGLHRYTSSPFVNEYVLCATFCICCFCLFSLSLRWVTLARRAYYINAQLKRLREQRRE